MDQIRACHTGVIGISAVDGANGPLWNWDTELSGHSGGLIADLGILRTDLARILYEPTRFDVEYWFCDAIVELTEQADGVDVTFAGRGSRNLRCDGGCGRAAFAGPAPPFGPESGFVRDQGFYGVIFAVRTAVELGNWQLMHVLPGGRRAGLYPTGVGPTRGCSSFASPPLEYERHDVDQQKRIGPEAFARAG
jgi:hypothetical protein